MGNWARSARAKSYTMPSVEQMRVGHIPATGESEADSEAA